MKATSLKTAAVMAASLGLFAGSAMAQGSAVSGVVGYETLDLVTGFNFVGVRLHQTPLASGDLEVATPTSVTDNDVDLGALITAGTYILEIEDGSGIIQEVTAADGTGLTVAADLTGLTFPVNYTLRAADTLASVFGNAAAGHALDIGAAGLGGADQVWLWNGAGFDKYYFDQFGGATFDQETWQDVDTGAAVDGATIDLIYADGFIISSAAGKDVVVTGDLKAGATELNLVGGFNFVSSVGPVGVDLATAFGTTAAEVTATGLGIGAAGIGGADQIWLWNGAGFDKVYFDSFGGATFDQETWQNVDTGADVADDTALGAGYVISAASGKNVVSGVPSYYAGL